MKKNNSGFSIVEMFTSKAGQVRTKLNGGFSIIEMLISLALLSVVMIITTQSLTSSLRNSKKSDSVSTTRENVDYAISTMERLLRNAQTVSTVGYQRLNYVDEFGNSSSFWCDTSGSNPGFIASGSAGIRLTSPDVQIVCDGTVQTFRFTGPSNGVPASVMIVLRGRDRANQGTLEGSVITSTTKILLRNYTVF